MQNSSPQLCPGISLSLRVSGSELREQSQISPAVCIPSPSHNLETSLSFIFSLEQTDYFTPFEPDL